MANMGAGEDGSGGHLPPQNEDAEISVLGALMVAPNLIAGVTEILQAGHFYRPSHQRIYETIEHLYGRGEPVDPITVSEELSNRGLLEAVGGRAYVHSLVSAVPAATNARYYAEIVRENYLLRSLIGVGSDIAEMGYRREGEPVDLIDRAEQMVFDISQNRMSSEFVPIGEVISESFAELEKTMTEGRISRGVVTGFRRVDDIITGFQPANLVILAARPSMGKTAFALNVARNVAVEQSRGVALFSLEMSKLELVQRVMCAEARVDSQRLRHGQFQAAEWGKLAAGCEPLYNAPIFIDDTASINLMEIRSKCRRLKAKEKGLGLIIIDYLQLMVGDTSSENRQQEISRISRGLKILARELDVPVLALSQLSRQVEQRAGNRPLLSDLRECVTGDTLVQLADGRRIPVADLQGSTPEVLAVSGEHRVGPASSDRVWRVGPRQVFSMCTRSRRRLRATAGHRVLGSAGWVTVGDLREGDRIALAGGLPEPRESVERRGAARNDLFWEEVTEILPDGVEEVFDLTVPGPASWLSGDGIVSHNSGAIEQDADCVLFIYRDEVYNKETVDKGIAELIVGKQRNGPIGQCRLAFIQNYTRFADLPEDARPKQP
jgi:replicative DNA helicase